MAEIKIQTIAHGSQIYKNGSPVIIADGKVCIAIEDIIEAYQRFDDFLKNKGKVIVPQKIKNKLLEEGIIGPSNGTGAYLFNECLVENSFVPTFFDGSFHVVGIAGQSPKVSGIISLVKNPGLDYSHCNRKPQTYNIPDNFNLTQFKSIPDLEKFLKK